MGLFSAHVNYWADNQVFECIDDWFSNRHLKVESFYRIDEPSRFDLPNTKPFAWDSQSAKVNSWVTTVFLSFTVLFQLVCIIITSLPF